MRRTLLHSKIHRATVTGADLDYEGSVSVDTDLLEAADILPGQQVHIWNITRGTRIVTYALPGEAGSGTICINGAAAHQNEPGDLVIIDNFRVLHGRSQHAGGERRLLCGSLARSSVFSTWRRARSGNLD